MNKNEFITEVAMKSGLSKVDTKNVVDAMLETITETLAKKESVAFIGFGTFTTIDREKRTAKVPGTTIAKFKVGKALKEAVAQK